MAGRAPTSEHARAAAAEIVGLLRARGHVAYFAGGCVRDELLGLAPSDYDVATDATPDRVKTLFPRSDLVGACFGVVLVKQFVRGEVVVVEVATFRADGAYTDSRRPDEVRFSTPEEDAKRRDFTVNALFLDPQVATRRSGVGANAGNVSGVIDFVGGVADLESRVLRAVGDPAKRLAEDHLRALRAVRLVSKLGFTLEMGTAKSIREHASELRGVSRERVGDEMRRMLLHPSRAEAMALLRDLSLERPVLLVGEDGYTLTPDRHVPGLVLAKLGREAPLGVVLGAWALDLGLDVWTREETGAGAPELQVLERRIEVFVASVRRALCLSNEERDEMRQALAGLVHLAKWGGLGVAAKKRLAAGPGYAGGVELLGVLDPRTAGEIRAQVADLSLLHGGISPIPCLTGDDLVSAGWTPGPRFKHVLEMVYDAQLEGRILTRAQGLELAETMRV
jgi:poly(A) polymerase